MATGEKQMVDALSKYEKERFQIQAQHEIDAEFILEEIMGRMRWTRKVRDDLVGALDLIERRRPLRTVEGSKRHHANADFIIERIMGRRFCDKKTHMKVVKALYLVARKKPLRDRPKGPLFLH